MIKTHFVRIAAIAALVLSLAGVATPALAYIGGGFVAGSVVVTPTPTPSETPVVLGASTTLPETGLSFADAVILSICGVAFAIGAGLMISSVDLKLK